VDQRHYPEKGTSFGFLVTTGNWKLAQIPSRFGRMLYEVRCPHGVLKYIRASRLKQGSSNTCHRWQDCPTFRISCSPEYRTAILHFDCISNRLSGYKGMPFYSRWVPNKKYSRNFEKAALWIRDNLGKRPAGSSLHIISHQKGFVPGNLEWTYPRKQSNQQMHKIIAQLKHKIKTLEKKIQRRMT